MRNSRERRRVVCPSGKGPREVHRGRLRWGAEFERETWIRQKQKIGEKNRSEARPLQGPEKTEPADVRAMIRKRNSKHEDDGHERRYELGDRKSWLGLGIFDRSEEHTSELQSQSNLVCRLLLEKKKKNKQHPRKSTIYNRILMQLQR